MDTQELVIRQDDGTVNFLPNRLNRQPVVVLGLTADELFFTGGSSVVIGIVLGIPLAIATSTIAVVPTMALLMAVVGILVGGRLLRRLKRGRPDDWFYRNLQWQIALRYPALTVWAGGDELIKRSGIWLHRREL